MEQKQINEMVSEHQRGVPQFREIAQALIPLLSDKARFYARQYGIERNELLSEFMFKLPKLIDRFNADGGVFEHYVLSSLKWFARDMKRDTLLERSNDAYLFHSTDGELRSVESRYEAKESEVPSIQLPSFHFNEASLKQRIVILLLKSALHVRDEHIERVAAFTGENSGFLRQAVMILNERLFSRNERKERLLGNRRWVDRRLHYLRSKMSKEYDEPARTIIMGKIAKLEVKRDRLDAQVRNLPDGPSHADIAEILGIPRGSVDSSLYYLKNQYKRVFKEGA